MKGDLASKMLDQKEIRKTDIRKSILSLLLKVKSPLSHQDILAHSSMKPYNRVTTYRTLETLLNSKLLHRAIGPDGTWRFCANTDPESGECSGNHIHFACLECKKMFCIPDSPLPWVALPKGAEVQGKQLLVYGNCSKCLSRKKK